MTGSASLAGLVFLPLLAGTLAAVLPARAGRALVLGSLLGLPLLLLAPTVSLHGGLRSELLLAGYVPPLGIRLVFDGLAALLLWLVAIVGVATSLHAWHSIGAARTARRFWPLWGMCFAGLNLLLLSADLFNIYVGLELVSLAAVALVAWVGTLDALRAAMRYLLLAMLGSLFYLLGVALVYAGSGSLDISLAGQRLDDEVLRGAALVLMSGGLLLKAAVFPLHGWLPFAHANAPGPVSAVLSALVVKVCLVLLYRLWFDGLVELPPAAVGNLLAALGGAAVLFGSLLALRQQRLKRLVAYSTVAQLGYLMLVFALPTTAAWQGTVYFALSHGLAKAAMFLAAANLMQRLGSDALIRLRGADARLPLSVFAFALAGVSLMGLPPSGGFLAKWLLLSAAWAEQAWHWVAVLMLGSLLAAAYLFRVLALMFSRPAARLEGVGTQPSRTAELAALALALGAIALGFVAAPLLDLLEVPAAMAVDAIGEAVE